MIIERAAQHRLRRTGGLRRPKACYAIIGLAGPTSPALPPTAEPYRWVAHSFRL